MSHDVLTQTNKYYRPKWDPYDEQLCLFRSSDTESPRNRPIQSLRYDVVIPHDAHNSVGGYCFWTCLFLCFCGHMSNKFKISTETWKDMLGNWQNAEFGLREMRVVSGLVTFYWKKETPILSWSVLHQSHILTEIELLFMWRNAFQDLHSQGSHRCCRSLTLSSASLFSHYHLWSRLDVFPPPLFMLHWGLYLYTAFIFSSIGLQS